MSALRSSGGEGRGVDLVRRCRGISQNGCLTKSRVALKRHRAIRSGSFKSFSMPSKVVGGRDSLD